MCICRYTDRQTGRVYLELLQSTQRQTEMEVSFWLLVLWWWDFFFFFLLNNLLGHLFSAASPVTISLETSSCWECVTVSVVGRQSHTVKLCTPPLWPVWAARTAVHTATQWSESEILDSSRGKFSSQLSQYSVHSTNSRSCNHKKKTSPLRTERISTTVYSAEVATISRHDRWRQRQKVIAAKKLRLKLRVKTSVGKLSSFFLDVTSVQTTWTRWQSFQQERLWPHTKC